MQIRLPVDALKLLGRGRGDFFPLRGPGAKDGLRGGKGIRSCRGLRAEGGVGLVAKVDCPDV